MALGPDKRANFKITFEGRGDCTPSLRPNWIANHSCLHQERHDLTILVLLRGTGLWNRVCSLLGNQRHGCQRWDHRHRGQRHKSACLVDSWCVVPLSTSLQTLPWVRRGPNGNNSSFNLSDQQSTSICRQSGQDMQSLWCAFKVFTQVDTDCKRDFAHASGLSWNLPISCLWQSEYLSSPYKRAQPKEDSDTQKEGYGAHFKHGWHSSDLWWCTGFNLRMAFEQRGYTSENVWTSQRQRISN